MSSEYIFTGYFLVVKLSMVRGKHVQKSCAEHGVVEEQGALFCSKCGRELILTPMESYGVDAERLYDLVNGEATSDVNLQSVLWFNRNWTVVDTDESDTCILCYRGGEYIGAWTDDQYTINDTATLTKPRKRDIERVAKLINAASYELHVGTVIG